MKIVLIVCFPISNGLKLLMHGDVPYASEEMFIWIALGVLVVFGIYRVEAGFSRKNSSSRRVIKG
jgi:hypothetical protein